MRTFLQGDNGEDLHDYYRDRTSLLSLSSTMSSSSSSTTSRLPWSRIGGMKIGKKSNGRRRVEGSITAFVTEGIRRGGGGGGASDDDYCDDDKDDFNMNNEDDELDKDDFNMNNNEDEDINSNDNVVTTEMDDNSVVVDVAMDAYDDDDDNFINKKRNVSNASEIIIRKKEDDNKNKHGKKMEQPHNNNNIKKETILEKTKKINREGVTKKVETKKIEKESTTSIIMESQEEAANQEEDDKSVTIAVSTTIATDEINQEGGGSGSEETDPNNGDHEQWIQKVIETTTTTTTSEDDTIKEDDVVLAVAALEDKENNKNKETNTSMTSEILQCIGDVSDNDISNGNGNNNNYNNNNNNNNENDSIHDLEDDNTTINDATKIKTTTTDKVISDALIRILRNNPDPSSPIYRIPILLQSWADFDEQIYNRKRAKIEGWLGGGKTRTNGDRTDTGSSGDDGYNNNQENWNDDNNNLRREYDESNVVDGDVRQDNGDYNNGEVNVKVEDDTSGFDDNNIIQSNDSNNESSSSSSSSSSSGQHTMEVIDGDIDNNDNDNGINDGEIINTDQDPIDNQKSVRKDNDNNNNNNNDVVVDDIGSKNMYHEKRDRMDKKLLGMIKKLDKAYELRRKIHDRAIEYAEECVRSYREYVVGGASTSALFIDSEMDDDIVDDYDNYVVTRKSSVSPGLSTTLVSDNDSNDNNNDNNDNNNDVKPPKQLPIPTFLPPPHPKKILHYAAPKVPAIKRSQNIMLRIRGASPDVDASLCCHLVGVMGALTALYDRVIRDAAAMARATTMGENMGVGFKGCDNNVVGVHHDVGGNGSGDINDNNNLPVSLALFLDGDTGNGNDSKKEKKKDKVAKSNIDSSESSSFTTPRTTSNDILSDRRFEQMIECVMCGIDISETQVQEEKEEKEEEEEQEDGDLDGYDKKVEEYDEGDAVDDKLQSPLKVGPDMTDADRCRWGLSLLGSTSPVGTASIDVSDGSRESRRQRHGQRPPTIETTLVGLSLRSRDVLLSRFDSLCSGDEGDIIDQNDREEMLNELTRDAAQSLWTSGCLGDGTSYCRLLFETCCDILLWKETKEETSTEERGDVWETGGSPSMLINRLTPADTVSTISAFARLLAGEEGKEKENNVVTNSLEKRVLDHLIHRCSILLKRDEEKIATTIRDIEGGGNGNNYRGFPTTSNLVRGIDENGDKDKDKDRNGGRIEDLVRYVGSNELSFTFSPRDLCTLAWSLKALHRDYTYFCSRTKIDASIVIDRIVFIVGTLLGPSQEADARRAGGLLFRDLEAEDIANLIEGIAEYSNVLLQQKEGRDTSVTSTIDNCNNSNNNDNTIDRVVRLMRCIGGIMTDRVPSLGLHSCLTIRTRCNNLIHPVDLGRIIGSIGLIGSRLNASHVTTLSDDTSIRALVRSAIIFASANVKGFNNDDLVSKEVWPTLDWLTLSFIR